MDSIFEFASTVTVEDGKSQRDSQFVFVTDHDRHYIRSHLMRSSWTKRSRKKPRNRPEERNILPAISPEIPRDEGSNSTNRHSSIEELVSGHQDDVDIAVLTSLRSETSLQASSTGNKKKAQRTQRPCSDSHHMGSASLNLLKKVALSNNHESGEAPELNSNQDAAAKDFSHKESFEQYMRYSQPPGSRDSISSWEVSNFDPFQTCPATVKPFEHSLIHHC
jgi:hypothetical protein